MVTTVTADGDAKLGKRQIGVLKGLAKHGGWHDGCGWLWGTPSGTERLCRSLVSRGLAVATGQEGSRQTRFELTEAGRELAASLQGPERPRRGSERSSSQQEWLELLEDATLVLLDSTDSPGLTGMRHVVSVSKTALTLAYPEAGLTDDGFAVQTALSLRDLVRADLDPSCEFLTLYFDHSKRDHPKRAGELEGATCRIRYRILEAS